MTYKNIKYRKGQACFDSIQVQINQGFEICNLLFLLGTCILLRFQLSFLIFHLFIYFGTWLLRNLRRQYAGGLVRSIIEWRIWVKYATVEKILLRVIFFTLCVFTWSLLQLWGGQLYLYAFQVKL